MSAQKVITTLASAQTLTGSYVVTSALASMRINAGDVVTFDLLYTTGAAEAGTSCNFKIEISPDETTWYQLQTSSISSGVETLVAKEYKFGGGAGATAYKTSKTLQFNAMFVRVSVKETGVGANFGTVTVKATIGQGASFVDVGSLGNLTIDEFPAAATLTDNFATPTTTSVGAFGMVYDGATWDFMRGDATNGVKVQPASGGEGAVGSTTTRVVYATQAKTFTDSTVSVTGSSGTVLASNANRKVGTSISNAAGTGVLYLNATDAAVVGQGWAVQPGQTFTMSENEFTTAAITGISSSGTITASVMEAT